MKDLTYPLIALLLLFISCSKESLNEDFTNINPASHIKKETTVSTKLGVPIIRLGYADIIKQTTNLHIDKTDTPFKKVNYSIAVMSDYIAGASEIFLISNTDTIAYVPRELINEEIFNFHHYPN